MIKSHVLAFIFLSYFKTASLLQLFQPFWAIRFNMKDQDLSRYWKKNIQYVIILLSIWFISSYVLGIIFVEQLNTIMLAGFLLGFWMAHQGAIYIFVILIFVYVYLMNRLDKQFGVEEE